ncbi:MAG: DUF5678 domain-containing protein [Anaerolineales bacterium]|nr:DUF5678 domain-containing protein [Anaerolineales bacterium]
MPKSSEVTAPQQLATPAGMRYSLLMADIPLQASLLDEIKAIADEEGVAANDLITEAVRRHVALYRQKRIAAESAAWYGLPAEERRRYAGRYVAVLNGRVIDHDSDRLALYARIRGAYPRKPVAILEGGDHPMPVYRFRSPRRV